MEYYDYLKFFIALIFIVSLMGALAFILKRFVPGGTPFVAPSKRRLKIVEMLILDHKRKALLIKRDDQEHLIIIGQNSDIVVERNINSVGIDDKR